MLDQETIQTGKEDFDTLNQELCTAYQAGDPDYQPTWEGTLEEKWPEEVASVKKVFEQSQALLDDQDIARSLDRALDSLSKHGENIFDTCAFTILEEFRSQFSLPQPERSSDEE
jgi:hypothetical protein